MEQFYPTPPDLAAKLVAKAKSIRPIKYPVLDPSAGVGALLGAVKPLCRPVSCLHAIEINAERRFALQGKGYTVLGSDWIAYDEPVEFPTVIMNPPFRYAEEHVLKAWDYLQPSGVLIALIDTACVTGALNKREQVLVNHIDSYGDVEHLGSVFEDAERQTSVEVSMISLVKPDKKAFEFSGFDVDHLEADDFSPQALSQRDVVKDLVARYKGAVEALKARHLASQQLQVYVKDLSIASEGDSNLRNALYAVPDFQAELQIIKSRFWQTVFDKSKIAERTTSKFRKDFSAFSTRQQHLAFTEANIKELLSMLYLNGEQIMTEGLVECWEKCVAYYEGNKIHTEGWKSNRSYKVQKRVIIPHAVSDAGLIVTRFIELFEDLEVCLSYLSGTPNPQTKLPSWGNAHGDHDTPYFTLKFFRKGTVHLIWKDLNLLSEFNRVAAQGKKEIGNGK